MKVGSSNILLVVFFENDSDCFMAKSLLKHVDFGFSQLKSMSNESRILTLVTSGGSPPRILDLWKMRPYSETRQSKLSNGG